MAVEAHLAVKAGAVADLMSEVERRIADIINDERRTKAIIATLKAIFGDKNVVIKDKADKDELPAEIRHAGYALVLDFWQDGWFTGIQVMAKKYGTWTEVMIKSPQEPWELEAPKEDEPREPRAVIDKAVLDVLRQRLPAEFKPFVHVAERCSYCDEATRMYFGFQNEAIPLYIYVEETFPCACERDP